MKRAKLNNDKITALYCRLSKVSDIAGIPCLILGLCQGSTGVAVTDGHSGHKSDPSVYLENRLDTLEKKRFFEYNEIVAGAGM